MFSARATVVSGLSSDLQDLQMFKHTVQLDTRAFRGHGGTEFWLIKCKMKKKQSKTQEL